jgi:hypothetical protein
MRILYVSHDVSQPRAGIRVLYDHVAALRGHGLEAFVVHAAPGFRYPFAPATVPVLGSKPGLRVSDSDVLVVPEDYPGAIRMCAQVTCRKVLLCQNHFYVFEGLRPGEAWADFGFSGYMCVSRPIRQALRRWFGVDAHVVRPAIEEAYFGDGFKPLSGPIAIACMPRKGLHNIRLVQGLLAVDRKNISWLEIEGVPKEQVAARLREAHVYVSTSIHEGLGMPPLEAMATGCLVVGFTGGGGLDYASAENGVWVADQDPWALADALKQTIDALEDPAASASLDAKRRAGRATAETYARPHFERELMAFWSAYLTS